MDSKTLEHIVERLTEFAEDDSLSFDVVCNVLEAEQSNLIDEIESLLYEKGITVS